jgi:hypothetical protein
MSARGPLIAGVLGAISLFAAPASAHTPFFRPLDFYPDTNTIYAEAAYSTDIFLPVVGMPATTLQLIAPDGQARTIRQISVEPYLTTVEGALPEPGTYRFSTGELYGAPTPMVFDHGDWRAVRPGEHLGRRARTSSMRIVALAETYVTRGAPTRTAVDVSIGRLAIHPISHPNQVTVASGFDVELRLDGVPFAHMPFVIYEPTQSEDDMRRVFVTDDQGRAHLTFDHAGTYLAVVRYRPQASPSEGVAVLSYSTSLTFGVYQTANSASP